MRVLDLGGGWQVPNYADNDASEFDDTRKGRFQGRRNVMSA